MTLSGFKGYQKNGTIVLIPRATPKKNHFQIHLKFFSILIKSWIKVNFFTIHIAFFLIVRKIKKRWYKKDLQLSSLLIKLMDPIGIVLYIIFAHDYLFYCISDFRYFSHFSEGARSKKIKQDRHLKQIIHSRDRIIYYPPLIQGCLYYTSR